MNCGRKDVAMFLMPRIAPLVRPIIFSNNPLEKPGRNLICFAGIEGAGGQVEPSTLSYDLR